MKPTGIAMATLAVAGALLAGGGVAAAGEGQGQSTARKADGDRCQRFVAQIAHKQGITVAALEAKWKRKASERIDATLGAGRITADQAKKLKARVDEWKLCDAGTRKARPKPQRDGGLHIVAAGSMVAGAMDYLDVTRKNLFAAWRAGKSLADVAAAKNKSVADLKTAMLAKIKARLDKAVADDKLTDQRRDALMERYAKLADRLIAQAFKPKSS